MKNINLTIDEVKEKLAGKIIEDIPGEVLSTTLWKEFDFQVSATNEIDKYCREQGYNVDKIVISSYLSSDCGFSDNIKSCSNARLFILEENNQLIAILYMITSIDRKQHAL